MATARSSAWEWIRSDRVLGPAMVLVFFVLVVGTLTATEHDLRRAAIALVEGSIGSRYAFFSATLVRAVPLILCGLAVTIAFRAGVLNIGAEGQLLVGAAAACAVGLSLPGAGRWPLLAMLIAGSAAGALFAGIAAWLRTRFGVLEVISTILLNFVAANVVGYLVHGPLQEPTHVYPQTVAIADASRLPTFDGTRLHAGITIAIVACLAAASWLKHTAGGFRLRVSGANPDAARMAGRIDVARVTTLAFLTSGAIAGLAGAVELSGVTFALYENISPGYGFTAIAVALLARNNPAMVVATGVLFGALEAGGSAMQRDANVPSVIVSVIEASIILLLLAWRGFGARATAGGDAR